MPCADLESVFGSVNWIAFLRDPKKRMASAYRQMCRTIPNYRSFEEYCSIETHQDQQCRMFCGEPDAKKALEIIEQKNVFVGIQELFDESLYLIKADRLPMLNVKYRKRNVSPEPHEAQKILNDERSLELLRTCNQQDQILYDTIRDGRFATLQQKHGQQNNNKQLSEHIRQSQAGDEPGMYEMLNRYHSKIKRRLIFIPAVKIYRTALKAGLINPDSNF